MRFICLAVLLFPAVLNAEILTRSVRDNKDGSFTFNAPYVNVNGTSYAISASSAGTICSALGYTYSLEVQYKEPLWGKYQCVGVYDQGYTEPAEASHMVTKVTCTNEYALVMMRQVPQDVFTWEDILY